MYQDTREGPSAYVSEAADTSGRRADSSPGLPGLSPGQGGSASESVRFSTDAGTYLVPYRPGADTA